jgi:hypothetical protein
MHSNSTADNVYIIFILLDRKAIQKLHKKYIIYNIADS